MIKETLKQCYLNSQLKDINHFVEECVFCVNNCVLKTLEYNAEEKALIIENIIKNHNGTNNN